MTQRNESVQNVGAKAIRLREPETVGKFHERKRLESIIKRREGLKSKERKYTRRVIAHGDLLTEFVHRQNDENRLGVTRNMCDKSAFVRSTHGLSRLEVDQKRCHDLFDSTASDLHINYMFVMQLKREL